MVLNKQEKEFQQGPKKTSRNKSQLYLGDTPKLSVAGGHHEKPKLSNTGSGAPSINRGPDEDRQQVRLPSAPAVAPPRPLQEEHRTTGPGTLDPNKSSTHLINSLCS